MKLILQDRQSGKTFRLIQESAETGAIIVVVQLNHINYIIADAEKQGLKIPTPITWRQYLDSNGVNPSTKYLIDNLDLIIKNHFKNIETITMSNPWK